MSGGSKSRTKCRSKWIFGLGRSGRVSSCARPGHFKPVLCPAYSSASRAQFPFLPIFPDSLCLNRQTLITRVWKHPNNHVEQPSCDSAIFGLEILKVSNAFELTRFAQSMQSEGASCQQHAQRTLEGLHTLRTSGSLSDAQLTPNEVCSCGAGNACNLSADEHQMLGRTPASQAAPQGALLSHGRSQQAMR